MFHSLLFYARKAAQRQFRAKYKVDMVSGNYRLKTADSTEELEAALKLRYKIYSLDILDSPSFLKIETDRFDWIADHLLLIDNTSNEVVGTYRILDTVELAKSYVALEFKIEALLEKHGRFLELGRACVRPDFRNGQTLMCLWKGIAAYVKASECFILLGVASEWNAEYANAEKWLETLPEKFRFLDHPELEPTAAFQVDENAPAVVEEEFKPGPLLRGYFSMGAKICTTPAHDRDYECLDFLTFLDFNNLESIWKKRLGLLDLPSDLQPV